MPNSAAPIGCGSCRWSGSARRRRACRGPPQARRAHRRSSSRRRRFRSPRPRRSRHPCRSRSPPPQPGAAPQPGPGLPQGPGAAAGRISSPFAPGVTALPAEVCVAFAALDEQRAGRLREALQAAGARVVSTRVEQPSGYLVYVPPPPTRADAQQRLAALRAAGQADVFVVQDGPLRLAISVGLFRSEETARALVTRLQQRGETGLQIAPHGPVSVRIRLQAHWPDAASAAAAGPIGSRFDAAPRDCD
ncbi:MAG: SPOR domain-containing protein [Burkholderiaceae bacterium]|nr:SPOR domain-containing protein [Burkholderiaceae bacterium]